MKWFLWGLMIAGSMFSLAWYGAKEPNQTKAQKRTYGLIAIGIWLLMLVIGNTLL